ncbi:hypothetical protein ACFLZM_05730, partial [Thermodesulfobacteriota bacterium]
ISTSKKNSIAAFRGEGGLRSLVRKQKWRVADMDCHDPGVLVDLNHLGDYEKHTNRLYDAAHGTG